MQNFVILGGFCTFAAVFIVKRYEISSLYPYRLYRDFCRPNCDVILQRDATCYYGIRFLSTRRHYRSDNNQDDGIVRRIEEMKRIQFMAPVDWMRGKLSGNQSITYDTHRAYETPTGNVVTADDYQPRLIAKVKGVGTPRKIRFFQVRTKTSVNMTATAKRNLALMGGVGALFGSLVSAKSSAIYIAVSALCPKGITLRAFLAPIIREALSDKLPRIEIADGVVIVNPWVSTDTPNVPVSQEILDKFASELS